MWKYQNIMQVCLLFWLYCSCNSVCLYICLALFSDTFLPAVGPLTLSVILLAPVDFFLLLVTLIKCSIAYLMTLRETFRETEVCGVKSSSYFEDGVKMMVGVVRMVRGEIICFIMSLLEIVLAFILLYPPLFFRLHQQQLVLLQLQAMLPLLLPLVLILLVPS